MYSLDRGLNPSSPFSSQVLELQLKKVNISLKIILRIYCFIFSIVVKRLAAKKIVIQLSLMEIGEQSIKVIIMIYIKHMSIL